MTKLIVRVLLAIAVITGPAAVLTLASQPAVAGVRCAGNHC